MNIEEHRSDCTVTGECSSSLADEVNEESQTEISHNNVSKAPLDWIRYTSLQM